ncbi:MAG: hypothetical protein ABJA02_02780 [Acidobacteriota bacterium]
MEIAFKIIAVVLVGAAAYFYSIDEKDWLFASGVLSACSFFLSMRFAIKKKMSAHQSEEDGDDNDLISG